MFGQSRKKCRQREAEWAALNRSLAIIEFSPDGTILDANENFLQCMGFTGTEIVGRHHAMFMPEEDRDSPEYKAFWSALASGEFRRATFRRIAKGGREIWLNASYNPVRDSANRTIKVIKIATDVTEAQLASAQSLSQIQAIGRSQAVIEFELDGTILTANDNFLRASGYTLAEIAGRHHRMFVPSGEQNSTAYLEFWRALGGGAFRSGQFRRVAKGGAELWLQATYNPVLDASGRVVKVVKFATDVTQQVKARQHFNELITGVAGAAEQMSASVSEISATMRRSSDTAREAVARVAEASLATQKLDDAARAMSKIVDLINRITQQINLLALNAALEAARAGEAGRGFAVVAKEVRKLADQAETATTHIASEISGISAVSGKVVASLADITESIERVSGFVTATTAAVAEQNQATNTISDNMHKAAERSAQLWAA